MNKILSLVILFCLFFTSCQNDEKLPELVDKHKIRIELSGAFDENNLKTIFFTDGGENEGIAKNKIIWDKTKTIRTTLIVKNQANTYILKGFGDIIKDKKTNNYKIHFTADYKSKNKINIDDSYFIAGILGGNIDDKDNSLKIDIKKELKKDLRELDIPIAFPWMRLKTDNANKSFIKVDNILFRPIGNLIGFDIKSEVHDPVNIVGLNIKTNIFSCDGYFDLINSQAKEGEYPKFKPSTFDNEYYYTLSSNNPEDLKLKANESVKYFYTWVMGNNVKETDKKELSIGFDLKPVCRDSISIDEKNSIKSFKTPDFDRWTPKNITNITNGKPYFIKPKIQSTNLIITEVYHYNSDYNDHLNIIELYNPSIYPIDITKYYLARTTDTDKYYAFGNVYGNFSGAWLYPVYLTNGHTARTADNMSGEINDMKLNFTTFYGSEITPMIQGGKTILLLADKYYKYYKQEKPRDLIIEDPFGPGLYVRDICYNQLKSIQFIVCSDNVGDNKWNKPTDNNSHVLKFDPSMGFILYKKVDNPPYDKEINDVNTHTPNRFLAIDSYGPYFKNSFGNNPLLQYNGRFFVMRYDGIVFPSGGNYYTDQWKYIPNEDRYKGVDITSIGARYMSWDRVAIEIPDMPAGN